MAWDRATRKYVCTKCGYRAPWRQFGLFVRCPECGDDSIACAEIWDRFGPAATDNKNMDGQDTQDSREELSI